MLWSNVVLAAMHMSVAVAHGCGGVIRVVKHPSSVGGGARPLNCVVMRARADVWFHHGQQGVLFPIIGKNGSVVVVVRNMR